MDCKLIQLFFLAYVHVIAGALFGVLGTTFPDLQCRFKVGLDVVTGLILPLGLSTPVGCLLFPTLNNKINIYLMMAIMIALYCPGVAMIAMTAFIEVSFVATVITGFTCGLTYTGIWHISNVLFPEDGYAFHVVASGGSAGSFLAPFLAMPFLGWEMKNSSTFPQNMTNRQTHNYSTVKPLEANLQRISGKREFDIYPNASSSLSYCDTHSSAVYFVYIVIGSLGMPLIFAFCWYYVRGYSLVNCRESSGYGYTQMGTKKSVCEIVFFILLIVSFSLAYGLAYTYGTYLTTVGLEGPLHLKIQKLEVLMSLLWLHVFLGRLSSTILSSCLRQAVILYVCFTGEIIAMVLLVFFCSSEVFLWIGTLLLGFCSGPKIAALMVWCREYITLTPRVLGMFTIADCVGVTFLPYVSGQLISAYGNQSHNYYCLALALFQLVLLWVIHGLGVIIKNRLKRTLDLEKTRRGVK